MTLTKHREVRTTGLLGALVCVQLLGCMAPTSAPEELSKVDGTPAGLDGGPKVKALRFISRKWLLEDIKSKVVQEATIPNLDDVHPDSELLIEYASTSAPLGTMANNAQKVTVRSLKKLAARLPRIAQHYRIDGLSDFDFYMRGNQRSRSASPIEQMRQYLFYARSRLGDAQKGAMYDRARSLGAPIGKGNAWMVGIEGPLLFGLVRMHERGAEPQSVNLVGSRTVANIDKFRFPTTEAQDNGVGQAKTYQISDFIVLEYLTRRLINDGEGLPPCTTE